MKTSVIAITALGLSALTLAACESGPKPPSVNNACYTIAYPDGADGPAQYNLLAENQPQVEFCAARLEEMRLRFLGLGGSNREVTGYYNGQYIFVTRRGVYMGRSLNGARFFSLARTGDGRLAVPGTIQREIDAAAPAPSAN